MPRVSVIIPVYNVAPYLRENGVKYTVKHAIGKVLPWYGGERK